MGINDKVLRVNLVKAAFVARGTSLHAWCRKNGFTPTHVLRAIRGDYAGPLAEEAIQQLKHELGGVPQPSDFLVSDQFERCGMVCEKCTRKICTGAKALRRESK